jgi:predicted ArsR family transcriptional regulator
VRKGAGGRDVAAVVKIMAGLVAAGLAEWHTPEQPKGGRPTSYFRLKPVIPNRETDETPPKV